MSRWRWTYNGWQLPEEVAAWVRGVCRNLPSSFHSPAGVQVSERGDVAAGDLLRSMDNYMCIAAFKLFIYDGEINSKAIESFQFFRSSERPFVLVPHCIPRPRLQSLSHSSSTYMHAHQ